MNTTCQQYMIALAQTGSITRAAKQLNISQPALSNWITSLENQLGVQLIIRSKKQLIFTPAGQLYLNGCYRMMQIKQRTYSRISALGGTEKENIVISGTPNGGAQIFSSIFSSFRDKYPAVKLSYLEGYNRQTLQYIADGQADFGICSTLDLESADFEFSNPTRREMVLYLPSSHPLAYDASGLKYNEEFPTISLQKLDHIDFMMPTEEMSYYSGLISLFQKRGIRPQILFQSANVGVLYKMVLQGNGAAILPRSLFSPLDPVSPFSLRPKFIIYSVLAYKKGKILTPAQELVRTLICEQFEISD
ncbi:MAG TPA: LysR family transcriptional regulator [Candidatus Lachnoclostridium pullistercoris]|uniref:LysR family transcriptional regulator n=1 Tax=Candidatus Lachnoclostridium pullistercoris TaxID=2838632 RepID=A0A9D2P9H0_9FIRM|nr:LysR family transcriptional regulator [Candidatus Lachnoclostridium pullistercoris]